MHSRIFEISQEPIEEPKDRWFYEDDDYVREHTDYVVESPDREADKKWLMNVLPKDCFTLEGDCLTMIKQPTEFVDDSIEQIRKLANSLTRESLTSIWRQELWQLKRAVCNIFWDTFIFDIDGDYKTYREWLWKVSECPVGTKWYIGAIIDYHN